MKYGIAILVLLLSLSSVVLAQEEEDETTSNRRERRGGIVGGGGGVNAGWSFLNATVLNSELALKGLPQLNDGGMFLFGGHGYAYVMFIPNLRVGGMGYGGSLETRRDNNGRYQSTRLDVSAGGVTLEYVVPIGRLHFVIGALLGGGSYTLTLTETDNVAKTWDGLFPTSPVSATDSRHELVNNYFAMQPTFSAEYEIPPFMMVGLTAGYFGAFGDAWKMDDNFEMLNMPDFAMNGPFARLTLTFGLFLGEN